jgi:hypothetical protein
MPLATSLIGNVSNSSSVTAGSENNSPPNRLSILEIVLPVTGFTVLVLIYIGAFIRFALNTITNNAS